MRPNESKFLEAEACSAKLLEIEQEKSIGVCPLSEI
jgi:hypothetical protein